MHKDKNDAIISVEEMEFLSALMLVQDENKDVSNLLDYDVTGAQLIFLEHLGLADQLQMLARFDHQKFIFPLKIKNNGHGALILSFTAPDIYEGDDKLRFWRVSPEQSLSLLAKDGKPLHYIVKDISASGICLGVPVSAGKIPSDLDNIFLQLPDDTLLPLQGHLTRFIDATTVAFELDKKVTSSKALKNYLFKMHRNKYSYQNNSQNDETSESN